MNTTTERLGSAYLIALVAMCVALVLGLALMRAADGLELFTHHKMVDVRLAQLAQAGLEYGYWLYAYKGQLLPVSATYTMSTGSLKVDVVDSDGDLDGSFKVTATATVGNAKKTVRKVFEDKGPGYGFDRTLWSFALAANEDPVSDALLRLGTGLASDGDAMFNSSLTLTNASTTLKGQVFAVGAVSAPAPVAPGTQSWNVPAFEFPTIDYAYYYALASLTYIGNTKLSGVTTSSTPKVIYVKGNLDISGIIRGRATFVVEGNINVTGSLTYGSVTTDKFAFLTTGNININGLVTHGLFYAHDASKSAVIKTKTAASMGKTNIIADKLSFASGKNITICGDTDYQVGTLAQDMRLPGM